MHGHHDHHEAEHDRGGRGGRHRARRGAIPVAIMTLLDERPMHGYEIITELESRSDGRWRPSPGAVYPALGKMEAGGAVTSVDDDGKKRFELTDAGRELLAGMKENLGDEAPWNRGPGGGRGELRRLMSELGGQVRQIGRFGTPEQRTEATAVLTDAKRRLYAILADDTSNDDHSGEPESSTE